MKPRLFKGIALFTPGGDLIYRIDAHKQENWHSDLCAALQRILELPEPPHFLIPNYTATADRWFDPYRASVKISAELYPPIQRYQPLLNAIFDLEDNDWQIAPWQEKHCNPLILETYRDQFPQLWQCHELIVRLDRGAASRVSIADEPWDKGDFTNPHQGYVLRLFVSGNHSTTKGILKMLHQFLEQELRHPYTLKVIDISKHPEQAENNQISATPTLVRVFPLPVRRIVGSLDNLPRVLRLIAQ